MGIRVTVRDGRTGRDQSKVDADGKGEVLHEFDADAPLDVGHRLTLPDGNEVEVIGVTDAIGPEQWTQVVSVGDVWSSS